MPRKRKSSSVTHLNSEESGTPKSERCLNNGKRRRKTERKNSSGKSQNESIMKYVSKKSTNGSHTIRSPHKPESTRKSGFKADYKNSKVSKSNQNKSKKSKIHEKKNAQKSSEKSKQRRQNLKKNASSRNVDDMISKNFVESEINKWKPLEKTTHHFLQGLMDSEISLIMTKKYGQKSEEVTEHLQLCRQGLLKMLQQIKTPNNRFGDYKQLNKLQVTYRETLLELENQEVILDEALSTEENSLMKLQKEIEELQQQNDEDTVQLHHLLCDFQPCLEIPPIPKSDS